MVTLVRYVIVFGLLGPTTGWVVICFVMSLGHEAVTSIQFVARWLGSALLFSFVGLPLAFAIGLVPALATGVCQWALGKRAPFNRVMSTLRAVLIGGILGSVVTAVVFNGNLRAIDLVASEFWQACFLPGALGSALCALVAERGLRDSTQTKVPSA